MTLLDKLQLASADAMDRLKGIAEGYGMETHVSIVISHPGKAEDGFIVGEHDLADVYAILKLLETAPRVERDVTSTAIGPNEYASPAGVQ